MIKIEEAKFYVPYVDFNDKKVKYINIFQIGRVKRSVAVWRTLSKEQKEALLNDDPLRFCFGDLWGHVEWEMQVGEAFGDETHKYDIYTLFIEPNRELLMKIVNSITKYSSAQYIKEDNESRRIQ